jgi:hypothetical protein
MLMQGTEAKKWKECISELQGPVPGHSTKLHAAFLKVVSLSPQGLGRQGLLRL